MIQRVQFDVVHSPQDCPVLTEGALRAVIDSLESLVDEVEKRSDDKVKIIADWYERNAHEFHYLADLEDIRIAQAEDILKQAIGLKKVTVTSHPTETGEQAQSPVVFASTAEPNLGYHDQLGSFRTGLYTFSNASVRKCEA